MWHPHVHTRRQGPNCVWGQAVSITQCLRAFFPRPDRYSHDLHSCILPSWINLGLFRISRPSGSVPFMDSKRLSMKKPHVRCRVMPGAFLSLPKISRHQDTWRLPKCLGHHVCNLNLCYLFPLCPSLSTIAYSKYCMYGYSKYCMYGFSHVCTWE